MDKYFIFDNSLITMLIVAGIPITIHYIMVFSSKPYKYKFLPTATFILLGALYLIFSTISDRNVYKDFVKARVDSEIISIRKLKQSRRYWLNNNIVFKLYSPYSVDLQLRDVVKKDSMSNHVRVYIQIYNGRYELKYDFNY